MTWSSDQGRATTDSAVHLYDAINIYNDDLARSRIPFPDPERGATGAAPAPDGH
jgi:hypothetical protein